MKSLLIVCGLILACAAYAQEDDGNLDFDREPASVQTSAKRTCANCQDEEELRVLAALPEAPLKTNARSVQKEVFKALYNKELKDAAAEAVEE
jgi:hypothetical protein